MYFMTITVVVLGGFSAIFIRFPPYHIVDREKKTVPQDIQQRRRLIEPYYLRQRPPMRRFLLDFVITIALIIYLTTESLCFAYISGIPDNTRIGITIGAIVLVLSLSLIAAPFPFLGGMSVPPKEELPPLPENSPGVHQLSSEGNAAASGNDVERDENVAKLDPQYQGTFWEDLRTLDLWLMWWNTLATWGCGLIVSFNSAQIYRALNDNEYDAATNAMYSAIIGVGSAFGRILVGGLETYILRRDPEKRPVITCLYPIASCTLVLGMVFLLALPLRSKAILIGFFLGSFGNGASWASTALTLRSLYAKDIGKHYNFMASGALIAVIALNRFAYGELLSQQARKNGTYPYCGGKACVQTAFIILLCVNVTAVAASLLVHIRYRRFVKKGRADRSSKAAASRQPVSVDDAEISPFSEKK
ncbi:hypothetical protein DQ04_18181000 [Trypanosoma grayi]|uniref:hypothetical protein n=1 Tax=Trypanosoma grayi TaxID=71804 RepID=UPI0004F44460|nr:hypothetical protein DQ04_18181000 [Trypanosoma grayi]KEG05817.1 hypothetical protein DQ04_18181000 [Trypanosoma grayi]